MRPRWKRFGNGTWVAALVTRHHPSAHCSSRRVGHHRESVLLGFVPKTERPIGGSDGVERDAFLPGSGERFV